MSRRTGRSHSPVALLGRGGRRALALLALVQTVKAVGLILIAEALATGVVSIIADDDRWRAAVAVGITGAVLRAAGVWAGRTLAQRASLDDKAELRRRLAQRLLRGRGGSVGAMTTLGTHRLDDLDDYFAQFLPALVGAAVVPVVVGARILFADWVSALIIVLTIPLVPLFMTLIGRQTVDAADRAAGALLRLSHHLVELAKGLPVLVGLGRLDQQSAALDRLSHEYRERTLRTLRTAFMSSLAMELIATISVAVVAVFIGVRLVSGHLDLEVGLLVLVLAGECYAPLREAGAAYHASEDGLEALRRVDRVVSTPAPRPLWVGREHVDGPEPLRVQGLELRYDDRVAVVAGLSFTARPGSATLLEGPSGSGKSSVLAVLAGRLGREPEAVSTDLESTERNDDATHRVAGGPARDRSRSELSRSAPDVAADDDDDAAAERPALLSGRIEGIDPARIAWVPQHPHATAGTVLDEVLRHAPVPVPVAASTSATEPAPAPEPGPIPAPGAAAGLRDRACAVLDELGIAHLAAAPPHTLSPGELRRLAIARALLRVDESATLLLLDEPTAHLDAHAARLVREAVAARLPRTTAVVASHDPAVQAACAQRVAIGASATAPHRGRASTELLEPTGDERPAPRVATVTDAQPASARERARLLWSLVRPARWRSALAVALGVLAAGFGVAQTAVSGWLIVRAAEQPPIMLLLVAIVGVRFFGLGRSVLRYAERLQLHDAVFIIAGDLRARLWRTLADAGLRITRLRSGPGALELLVGDVDRLRDQLPRVLAPPLVAAACMAALLITAAIAAPWALGPLWLLTAAALVLAPLVARIADRRASAREQRARSELASRFGALLEGADELAVHGAAGRRLDALDRLEARAAAGARRAAGALGLGHGLVALATSLAAVLVVASAAAAPGPIDGGMVAVIALATLALGEPLADGVAAAQRWGAARVTLDAVGGVLGMGEHGVSGSERSRTAPARTATPTPASDSTSPSSQAPAGNRVQAPGTAPVSGTTPALELRDATAHWPEARDPVFSGLQLRLDAGEWLTVTGPSGAGKSTLLALLLGHLPPVDGEVLLDGRPASARRGGTVAWCPQQSHLFDSTLRGNLALAAPAASPIDDERMRATLERVGLGGWLATQPDGLATRVGAGGGHLSGGQRQRVAVARALLTGAPVVLLDEPTAHLDDDGARSLIDDLHEALVDRAVVCVTHDPTAIRDGDRRLRLPRDARAGVLAVAADASSSKTTSRSLSGHGS